MAHPPYILMQNIIFHRRFYIFSVSGLDIFYGVSFTVCISLLTKFCDSSEMGKAKNQVNIPFFKNLFLILILFVGHLFAVILIFDMLIPFCHPTYNILFKKTIHSAPTTIYSVSFVLYLIAVIMFW